MKKITRKQTVNRLEEYVPKGCRKARTRIVQEEVSLSIYQVEESEAPVVFICHNGYDKPAVQVRLYKGKFYALELDYKGEGRWYPSVFSNKSLCFSYYSRDDDTNMEYLSDKDEDKQRENIARRLVIGDKVYYRCGQPYYGWNTFGCGVSWCFSVVIPEQDYKDYENRGISPGDKVMLQRKYDEFMKTSARECSFKSLDDALRYNYIEVLLPECCKRKFQSPLYEGDKWLENGGELQDELTRDLMKCAERLKKKYASRFEYLSNYDFACQFHRAADCVKSGMMKKVG